MLIPKLNIGGHSTPIDNTVWAYPAWWHSTQDLFDRAGDKLGMLPEAFQLFGVLVKTENSVAQGVRRCNVAGDEQGETKAHQIGKGQMLSIDLGSNEQAQDVVAGSLAALLDGLDKVGDEVLLCLRHHWVKAHQCIGPCFELPPLLAR